MSLFVLRELAGFFNEQSRFVALKTVSFRRKQPKQNQDESQQIFRLGTQATVPSPSSFYGGRTFLQSCARQNLPPKIWRALHILPVRRLM